MRKTSLRLGILNDASDKLTKHYEATHKQLQYLQSEQNIEFTLTDKFYNLLNQAKISYTKHDPNSTFYFLNKNIMIVFDVKPGYTYYNVALRYRSQLTLSHTCKKALRLLQTLIAYGFVQVDEIDLDPPFEELRP